MAKVLFFLLFPLLVFSMDSVKVMYITYNLKEKDFKKAVENVRSQMEREGVRVMRTLTISDAIRARGKDFRNYYVVFGCETERMEDILLKAPAISNIVPCSVAVYEDKDKRIKATVINHRLFMAKYGKTLSREERQEVMKTYRSLHIALAQLSTNRPRAMRLPPPKEELVYEETVQGLDFDTFKTLYKTALDGVNMNILDIVDVRKESPKFSIFLACNLSYGEAILKDVPQFGTLAPCRVYLYEKNGGVATGYINIPFLLKVYGRHLGKDKVEVFKSADKDIKQALKEAKGE
ncbi:MAG: DUF302 domain-containing protein [Acidobacteria bacterium]|jgi:uncharacterized protein (DUF302 family)|nr:MAG: DUF302 domain-containing protein [Acidobacteriota bacterium]